MKKKKIFYKIQILMMVLVSGLLLSFLPYIHSHASSYHSWMREGEEIYGDVGTASDDSDHIVYEPKNDSILKHLVNLINSITSGINEHLFKIDDPNYSISLSGIVMGRLADYKVSILKFELFEDNPWGLVGSVVYVVFRNVIYGLMFLYCAMLFVKQLFNNGAKGRAELKSVVSTVIFMFSLLYIMPWVINMFIIGRDAIILKLGEEMLGTRGLDISDSVLEVMGMSDEVDIVLAFIYFALMAAPLFYVVGYAAIAMQQTGLFGLFPVVALLSIRDKKLLNSWSGMFFSNLAVPFLDYIFLLIPIILKLIIQPEVGENIAYTVVTLCCIWSAQPARNAILRLFGNMGGAQANVAGMAALGMMAMRMLGGGGFGGGSGGNSTSITDDLTNAQKFENLSGSFNEALADTQREIGKIDSVDDIMKSSFSDIGGDSERDAAAAAMADGSAEESTAMAGSFAEEDTVPAVETSEAGTEAAVGDPETFAEGDAEVLSEGNGMPEGMPAETAVGNEGAAEAEEELSQRQVFQNARLDNLEKLDDAKNALNDQQAVVDQAENHFANVSGDVSQKETKLDHNNNRLEEISKQLTDDRQAVKEYDNQINNNPSMKQSLDAKYGDIEQRRARIGNLTNEQAALTAENATLTKEIGAVKSNPEYVKASQAVTEAKLKRDALSNVVQKRSDAEKAYATMMEGQGGKGKTYDNALSYRNEIKTIETHKNQTSWRNFDAHADTDVLSPDEKANYLRQRAEHKQRQAVVRNVAKTVGGVVGATAGMYGGLTAMAGFGAAGGSLAGIGAQKGMNHYNDNQDLKQAQAAGQTKTSGQTDVTNKYEQYVRDRREGKIKPAQSQTSTQNRAPIDDLRDSIRSEVRSNAERDNFKIKK